MPLPELLPLPELPLVSEPVLPVEPVPEGVPLPVEPMSEELPVDDGEEPPIEPLRPWRIRSEPIPACDSMQVFIICACCWTCSTSDLSFASILMVAPFFVFSTFTSAFALIIWLHISPCPIAELELPVDIPVLELPVVPVALGEVSDVVPDVVLLRSDDVLLLSDMLPEPEVPG